MAATYDSDEIESWAKQRMDLLCAGSLPDHPDVIRISGEVWHWVLSKRIAEGNALDELDDCRAVYYASSAMSNCSAETLRVVGIWHSWAFALELRGDETPWSPDFYASLVDLLRTGTLPSDPDPMHEALADVRSSLVAHGGIELIPELADTLAHYCESCLEETEWEKNGTVPELREYFSNRAARMLIEPLIVLHRLHPDLAPSQTPVSATLRELVELTATVSGLANDIIGYHLDRDDGASVSLIPILMSRYDLTLREAFASAVVLFDGLKTHLTLMANAVQESVIEPEATRRQARTLVDWVNGNYRWHLESTQRYGWTQAGNGSLTNDRKKVLS